MLISAICFDRSSGCPLLVDGDDLELDDGIHHLPCRELYGNNVVVVVPITPFMVALQPLISLESIIFLAKDGKQNEAE